MGIARQVNAAKIAKLLQSQRLNACGRNFSPLARIDSAYPSRSPSLSAHPSFFHRFSTATAHGTGQPWAFGLALGSVIMWAVTGPLFGFSETWQLVINTGTTIITFLMVFLVQHTQNRDNEAVQAKLDDLIYAVRKADNRLIGAEELTGEELHKLRTFIASKAHGGDTAVLAEGRHGDTEIVVAAAKAEDASDETRSPHARQPEKA